MPSSSDNSFAKTRGSAESETLLLRLHRALGPVAGGLILDFVDLATPGPVGVLGGFLVGGLAAWWITSIYELDTRLRVFFALAGMLYVALPLTALLPLATIISACARWQPRAPSSARFEESPSASSQAAPPAGEAPREPAP